MSGLCLKIVYYDDVEDEMGNETKQRIEISNLALVDEFPLDIKRKLFARTDTTNYPGFIRLRVQEGQDQAPVLVDKNRPIITYMSSQDPGDIVLLVDNIIEMMDLGKALELHTMIKNTEDFEKVLAEYRKEFGDLKKTDLEFVINYKLYASEDNPSEGRYAYLKNDIFGYMSVIKDEQEALIKQFGEEREVYNRAFYEAACKTSLSEYVPYFKEAVILESLTFDVKDPKFVPGVEGRFLKIKELFNILELNETIPFIALGRGPRRAPYVKVLNRIGESITEKEMTEWILNDRSNRTDYSYKKIKGIMLKVMMLDNVFTVNISENGKMTVKILLSAQEEESRPSYNQIMEMTNAVIDHVAMTINEKGSVFAGQRQLARSSALKIVLAKVTASVKTDKLVVRDRVRSALRNTWLDENVMSSNNTKTQHVLSLTYKKDEDVILEENAKKGIVVNLKDNPYKDDSSIITVFGAKSLPQVWAVVYQLVVLDKIDPQDKPRQRIPATQRSNIKITKRKGGKMLSAICQKNRQPVIDDKVQPLQGSYDLHFREKRYVCPNEKFPYPGFTGKDIVCCFEKNQRQKDTYIRNMGLDDVDIFVQASNFKVRLSDGKDHLVIKMEDHIADVPYFVVGDNDRLQRITDEKIINQIEEAENMGWAIFMNPVQLKQIIHIPPKNKCNFQPDFSQRQRGLHQQCEAHERNKFFGYTASSYPCCFDKEKEPFLAKRKDETDIMKQHLITTDKILDFKRVGTFAQGLDELFNKMIGKPVAGQYYRVGVKQNKAALLNAVLLGLNNVIDNNKIGSSIAFKRYLISYLTEHPTVFYGLNEGDISSKWGTLKHYTDSIRENTNVLKPDDLLDLLQKVAATNIYIVSIPYIETESTSKPDYTSMRLLCKPKSEYDRNLVLFKRHDYYDILMFLLESNGSVQYIFNNESPVIQFLREYHQASCVTEMVYPTKFGFVRSPTMTELINLPAFEMRAQVVNGLNKVNYAVLGLSRNTSMLIPVQECGIVDNVEVKRIGDADVPLVDVDLYTYLLDEIAPYFEAAQLPRLRVLGGTLDETERFWTGLQLNCGQVVPVAKSRRTEQQPIAVLSFRYHGDVDTPMDGVDDQAANTWWGSKAGVETSIYNAKREIARLLYNDERIRERLKQIMLEKGVARWNKMKAVVDVLKTLPMSEFNNTQDILWSIANDMLNDNVENALLNNVVVTNTFNPSEIIKRDGESVWTDIEDMKKWFKRHV